jgi:hypothetical protein
MGEGLAVKLDRRVRDANFVKVPVGVTEGAGRSENEPTAVRVSLMEGEAPEA